MMIKANNDLLYLEDIQVGQKFASDSYAVDEAQIKAFASQFDPQPFHLDEQAARDSLFGGLAASGWHTAAITMRLIVTNSTRFAGGVIGAWPSPGARPTNAVRNRLLSL